MRSQKFLQKKNKFEEFDQMSLEEFHKAFFDLGSRVVQVENPQN